LLAFLLGVRCVVFCVHGRARFLVFAIVCVFCVVSHHPCCVIVFLVVMSVTCWFNVRGGVYVIVCAFPVCCVLSVL